MNFNEIKSAIQLMECANAMSVNLQLGDSAFHISFASPLSDMVWRTGMLKQSVKDAAIAAREILERRLSDVREQVLAAATQQVLEARQEVNPDAHLDEITKRFGTHQRLNTNCSVMAWHLGGLVWLTDDENGRTVSLVTRSTGDDGAMCEIASQITPAHALRIWAMISEEER